MHTSYRNTKNAMRLKKMKFFFKRLKVYDIIYGWMKKSRILTHDVFVSHRLH